MTRLAIKMTHYARTNLAMPSRNQDVPTISTYYQAFPPTAKVGLTHVFLDIVPSLRF